MRRLHDAEKSSRLGKVSREVTGTRREAIASCKLEIDRETKRQRHAVRSSG
jgi:hypothetical protein